ncbi:MAG: EamA family transporter [Acidobacteriota bacterium]|jgi:drug/metabolite transporter (DMT)-like permease
MLQLLIVSVLWAFSFGLIKTRLAAVDPTLLAGLRLGLALLVFLPLLRLRGLKRRTGWRLVALGGLQFGVMYVAVLHAYRFLQGYEVALLTIFTPFWVSLIEDVIRRRFGPVNYLAAGLAVAGAAVIVHRPGGGPPAVAGVLLVQLSNLAFAAGQVLYRRMALPRRDHEVFGLLYLGGFLVAGTAAALTVAPSALRLAPGQIATILYLGVIASGLCFFLWNHGARRVSVPTLAVWNNGYIPLAVLVSLLVFHEPADLSRLAAGSALLLAAIALAYRTGQPTEAVPSRGPQ